MSECFGVKQSLVHAPVLAMPDFQKHFTVIVDASGEGDQELLAAVHAIKVWRCYLDGGGCTLVTDHNPTTFVKTVSTLSRRMTRWVEYLERFDYDWAYRPRRINVADPLSRSTCTGSFVGAIKLRLQNLKLESIRRLLRRASLT